MATTLTSDMKVYERQVAGSMTETLTQETDAIVSASNGAIILESPGAIKGNYEYESFFTQQTAVGRQDITSVAAATGTKLAQDDFINVKVHRRFQVESTDKAFKMAGLDVGVFNIVAGRQIAKEMITGQLNDGLLSARVALANKSAVTNDVTGASTKSITSRNLIGTLRKFGDRASRVITWVMHSEQWFDLALNELDNQVAPIYEGIVRIFDVPALGRRIVVTDSDSLIATADTPDSYYVLGLTQGGILLRDTEPETLLIDRPSGYEQILTRYQGEYAFNIGIKGFKWDVSNGGANPSSAALGTASNWDSVATSYKDYAGVVLKCQVAS